MNGMMLYTVPSVLHADNAQFLLVLSVPPTGDEPHKEVAELLPHRVRVLLQVRVHTLHT